MRLKCSLLSELDIHKSCLTLNSVPGLWSKKWCLKFPAAHHTKCVLLCVPKICIIAFWKKLHFFFESKRCKYWFAILKLIYTHTSVSFFLIHRKLSEWKELRTDMPSEIECLHSKTRRVIQVQKKSIWHSCFYTRTSHQSSEWSKTGWFS